MSKALVSMFEGPAELARPVTWPPMLAYAARHGYQLHEAIPLEEPGLAASWAKVRALLALLEEHELALWLDADMLVLGHAWDVATELPADCFQALAFDARIGPYSPIWLVRRTALAFLQELWARRHEEPGGVDHLIQRVLGCERETSLGTLRLLACWGDPEGCCSAPLMVHRGWDAGDLDWEQRVLVLEHEAQRGPRTPGGAG